MPWQGTTLWLADFNDDGTCPRPSASPAAPKNPSASPNGRPTTCCTSSPTAAAGGICTACAATASAPKGLCPMEAEFATPHWTFGNSMYGFRSASEIICTYIDKGVSRLARLLPGSGKLECIANPYEEIRELRVASYIAMLAGGPTIPMELARIDFTEEGVEILAQSIDDLPDEANLSIPTSISYPSNGRTAHALLPAAQPDVQAPEAASRR
jgi:hypothetical protein